MERNYDVAVFGAGVSGLCAALQSARLGKRTLLVEKNGMTGGTLTMAAIDRPAMFNAWGRQIIRGIGWELVERTLRECGSPLPDWHSLDARDHVGCGILVNPLIFAAIADEALALCGAELLLHAMPAALHFDRNNWHISLAAKDGPREIDAAMVVDCTGDADLVALCGGKFQPGETCQPASFSCLLGNFDPGKLDYPALAAALLRATENGELMPGDIWWPAGNLPADPSSLEGMLRFYLDRRGINANHIALNDPSSPDSRTELELAGRASILRAYRFLRKQPGLEHLTMTPVGSECGIREFRRILGKTTVTQADYFGGRLFDDAVCYSFYPIDLHSSQQSLIVKPLPEGTLPTVPRGALVPESLPHMLVAGRALSSDRMANSALRIQATCMATGQAAGALAASAAASDGDPMNVPMDTLRDLLRQHDAIVPPDLSPAGL